MWVATPHAGRTGCARSVVGSMQRNARKPARRAEPRSRTSSPQRRAFCDADGLLAVRGGGAAPGPGPREVDGPVRRHVRPTCEW
jgi:hypothetical protein